MSNRTTVNSLSARQAKGKLIGFYVWWGFQDAAITRPKLEALFLSNGLNPEKHMPPEIAASAAFRQALTSAREEGYLCRRVKVEKPEEIIYSVQREEVDDAAEDLDYNKLHRIVFNKKNKTVHLRGGSSKIGRTVKVRYEEYLETYITEDLRRMLVRNMMDRLGALCLRLHGGVYFVHARHAQAIAGYEKVIAAIPGNNEFLATEIHESPNNAVKVGGATKRALEEDLKDLQTRINDYLENPPRRDTLCRKLDEFKALKAKAKMYADMLSFKVDDLNQGLKDLDQVTRGIITGVEETMSAKALRAAKKRDAEEAKGGKRKIKRVAR
jgi:hypothetical protein